MAVTASRVQALELFLYAWLTSAMSGLPTRWSGRWRLELLPNLLVEFAGYGAFLWPSRWRPMSVKSRARAWPGTRRSRPERWRYRDERLP